MSQLKGTLEPTETNTMLCADNRYYDPNQLESYFVTASDNYSWFFGTDRTTIPTSPGFKNLATALAKDLLGSDS